MTGVHPPSPHPKFPMGQKTDNGWESTKRVTTPLTLDLLNQIGKKNSTSNESNDCEIKRAYKNNYHSYNGGNENDNGKDTEWL